MATILVTAAQDYVGTSCIDAALADTNVKQVIWLPYTPFSFPNKLASCNPKLSIVNMPDEASWTSWPASLGSHFKDVTGVVRYVLLSDVRCTGMLNGMRVGQ